MLCLVCAVDGCSRYQPDPLSAEKTEAGLAVPSDHDLQVKARELHYPPLPPLALDMSQPLGVDAIALIAVLHNPRLRGIRDQHHLAEAQVLQAGILPNPVLAANIDVPFAGVTDNTTVGLASSIYMEVTALISRHARMQAAQYQESSIDLSIAWEEWQTAAAARQAFYQFQGARLRLKVTRHLEAACAEDARLLARLLLQGLVTTAQETAAEDQEHDAMVQVMDLAREAEANRLNLNAIIGIPPAVVLVLDPSPWPSAVPGLEVSAADLEAQRLDLQALRIGYQSQEAALHAAILGQFPSISLGVSQQRDTGDVNSIGPGIVMEIPIFDRHQGAIATATAERQQLADEYVERVSASRHDLAAAQAEAVADGRRLGEAQRQALVLEQRLRDVSDAVGYGLLEQMDLSQARNAALAGDLERLQIQEHLAEALLAVAVTSGRYLPLNASVH